VVIGVPDRRSFLYTEGFLAYFFIPSFQMGILADDQKSVFVCVLSGGLDIVVK
jgi:hypothetical protein